MAWSNIVNGIMRLSAGRPVPDVSLGLDDVSAKNVAETHRLRPLIGSSPQTSRANVITPGASLSTNEVGSRKRAGAYELIQVKVRAALDDVITVSPEQILRRIDLTGQPPSKQHQKSQPAGSERHRLDFATDLVLVAGSMPGGLSQLP